MHPGLGIHHHNRYDPLCLVDDLMEPFRPLVDRIVLSNRGALEVAGQRGLGLSRESRASLAAVVQAQLTLDGEIRRLPDILSRVSASLAESFVARERRLVLPRLCL